MRIYSCKASRILGIAVVSLCIAARADRPYRGKTTANKDQYTVSRGGTPRKTPRQKNYVMNSYVYTRPAPQYAPVVGYAEPYTDYEYGKVLIAASQQSVEPIAFSSEKRLVSQMPGDIHGVIEANVLDVIDRGVMITDTREELRLRGVRIPSDRSGDEVSRYYGREAVRYLRSLAQQGPLYVMVGDPLRDKDGTLIGLVYLADGTEVNRLILDMGLGTHYETDFDDDADLDYMFEAEKAARESRKGLWSRRQ